jgi:hypothetical protein
MTDRELTAQIAKFERVVLQSDAELALTVLHPDYALVLVLPVPAVMTRARWLEVLPDYHVEAYDVQVQHLDVLEDCATVFQRLTMTATVLGGDRSGTFVISDVWLCGADGWRIWRRHSTPLAAGPMPGVGLARAQQAWPRSDESTWGRGAGIAAGPFPQADSTA